MVLRHLANDEDKQRLTLTLARTGSADWREVTAHHGLRMADMHLRYSTSYALLADSANLDGQMLVAISVHSLDQFAQTHFCPDLSGLRPCSILEIDRLWFSKRVCLQRILKGALVLSGLLCIDALVIYSLIAPDNYTEELKPFEPATEAIPITCERGDAQWVLGMALRGPALQCAISAAMRNGVVASPGLASIHFTDESNECGCYS
jgi:hypothetical protein